MPGQPQPQALTSQVAYTAGPPHHPTFASTGRHLTAASHQAPRLIVHPAPPAKQRPSCASAASQPPHTGRLRQRCLTAALDQAPSLVVHRALAHDPRGQVGELPRVGHVLRQKDATRGRAQGWQTERAVGFTKRGQDAWQQCFTL